MLKKLMSTPVNPLLQVEVYYSRADESHVNQPCSSRCEVAQSQGGVGGWKCLTTQTSSGGPFSGLSAWREHPSKIDLLPLFCMASDGLGENVGTTQSLSCSAPESLSRPRAQIKLPRAHQSFDSFSWSLAGQDWSRFQTRWHVFGLLLSFPFASLGMQKPPSLGVCPLKRTVGWTKMCVCVCVCMYCPDFWASVLLATFQRQRTLNPQLVAWMDLNPWSL